MIEVFDNALETKKFQRYAENADTVDKRIELCRKYLQSKGALSTPPVDIPPPKIEYRHYGNNTMDVVYNFQMDRYHYMKSPTDYKIEMMKTVAEGLKYELLKANLIKWNEYYDAVKDYQWMQGKLIVVKQEETK